MKTAFRFFLFVFVLSAVFSFGCSLFGDDDDDGGNESAESVAELFSGTASFRGTVALDGVFPRARRASSARTVLPSLSEEITYSVVAEGGGRTYTADVDGISFSFGDLAVSEDGTEYTITASGTTTINEGGAEKTVRVLFGKVVLLLRGGDAVSGVIPVEPEMQDGTGRLNIKISVPDAIRSCEVKYQKILGGGYALKSFSEVGPEILWDEEIDSGNYEAVFSFYNTESPDDENRILLYEFRETLHICRDLVSDEWFGASSHVTGVGECEITSEMLSRFALTRIYVSDRAVGDETGTRANPFSSIKKATLALFDKDADYTIVVDGTLTGAQEIPDSVTGERAKSITICGAHKNDGGTPSDAIVGGGDWTALSIHSDVKVVVRNVSVSGGNSSGNGGGVFIAENASVELGEGVRITENSAEKGGGVYNEGSLVADGCAILGNGASENGSGIFNAGVFRMKECTIKDAVFLADGKTIEIASALGDKTAARIEPETYSAGTKVIELSDGADSVTSLSAENFKFIVVQPENAPEGFFVSADGELASPFSFENGFFNGNVAEVDGIPYAVVEYADSLDFVVENPVPESTLEINGEAAPSGTETMSDGLNEFRIRISRENYDDVVLTSKMYAVKSLTEPEITFPNKFSVDGETIKFSYLKYDNLLMDVTNTYDGATITTTIDGGTPKTGDLTNQELDVGTHTIKVTVEKQYCTTQEFVKSVNVKINRVKAKVKNQVHHWHTDGGRDVDLIVTFYIESTKTGQQEIWSCYNYHKDNTHDYYDDVANDKVVYLYEKTDKFYFYTNRAMDRDGSKESNWDHLGTINKGDSSATRSLKDLKANPQIDTGDHHGDKNCKSRYWINVELSEEAAEPLFTFNPSRNGMRDGNNFEYIEVENASSEASYTISAQDGASISGTIDGDSFNGTKSGKLSFGEHTITVTSKQSGFTDTTITKKIKVVTPLKKPSLRIWNGTSNVAADSAGAEDTAYSDYNCYNVNLTAGGTLGTVEYIFDAESGVTVDVSDNGTERDGTDAKLALGPHTLTVTCSKPGYAAREFEEKVYIQGILGAPSIAFYKEAAHTTALSMHSHPEASSYLLYDSYDVELDKDGDCALYYKTTPANAGSTVTVTENSAELSGKLALGPHTITVTATRQYCVSKSVEKKIYVQGILSEPTFTPDGEKVKTEGTTEYWQYSYKKYDEMPITVTAGNAGNTVTLYMDGHEVETASLGYGTAGSVSVTQTRQYCKTLESESKWMDVSIKPITLTYNNKTGKGKLELKLSNFGNDPATMPLGANINIHAAGKEAMTAYNKEGDSVNQDTWLTLNDSLARSVEITLNNPSDEIIVYTDIWRTDKSNCTMRNHESTRSLSQIKEGKGENEDAGEWTFIVDMYEGYYSRKAQPRITFSVSD